MNHTTLLRGLFVLLCLLVGCRSRATAESMASASAVAPPPPRPMLPAPYEQVRLGLSLAELTRLFPPSGPIDRCAPQIVGEAAAAPAASSGASGQATTPPPAPSGSAAAQGPEGNERSSFCPGVSLLGGASAEEALAMMGELSDRRRPSSAGEKMVAWLNVLGQVRGSLRAGQLTEADLLAVAPSPLGDARGALVSVTDMLFEGALTFVRPRQARRPIAAVVREDCTGIDPERAREYVLGQMSFGQLDQQARQRVANGKCLGAYVQHEGAMQRGFVAQTGGLAGIGLARASRPDRQLKPDEPATYTVYSLRSGLSAPAARLGVRLANALPATERFWSGAIALSDKSEGPLGVALVWLEQGKVARVLVNLASEKSLPELQKSLTALHGNPTRTAGRQTHWTLPGGEDLTLDQGASLSLRLGTFSPPAATSATAPAPSASAP